MIVPCSFILSKWCYAMQCVCVQTIQQAVSEWRQMLYLTFMHNAGLIHHVSSMSFMTTSFNYNWYIHYKVIEIPAHPWPCCLDRVSNFTRYPIFWTLHEALETSTSPHNFSTGSSPGASDHPGSCFKIHLYKILIGIPNDK